VQVMHKKEVAQGDTERKEYEQAAVEVMIQDVDAVLVAVCPFGGCLVWG